MAEILTDVLSKLLAVMLIAPVAACLSFSIIDHYWDSRLKYNAKLAVAQAEAIRAMAGENREKTGKDEQHV